MKDVIDTLSKNKHIKKAVLDMLVSAFAVHEKNTEIYEYIKYENLSEQEASEINQIYESLEFTNQLVDTVLDSIINLIEFDSQATNQIINKLDTTIRDNERLLLANSELKSKIVELEIYERKFKTQQTFVFDPNNAKFVSLLWQISSTANTPKAQEYYGNFLRELEKKFPQQRLEQIRFMFDLTGATLGSCKHFVEGYSSELKFRQFEVDNS